MKKKKLENEKKLLELIALANKEIREWKKFLVLTKNNLIELKRKPV